MHGLIERIGPVQNLSRGALPISDFQHQYAKITEKSGKQTQRGVNHEPENGTI
jgi:hypothetical protein